MKSIVRGLAFAAVGVVVGASSGFAADDPSPKPQTVVCESKSGERQHCAADTSKGVALVRTLSNVAPCILGKTWGYDDTGIWVTDGCSAEFLPGQEISTEKAAAAVQTPEQKKKFLEHIPAKGFRLYEGDEASIYFRLYSYFRYLNQKGLDPTYTDYFGNTKTIQQRQDFELNKVFIPFAGWFLDPKFQFYLYAWASNTSIGEGGQTYLAGHIDYVFNKHFFLGMGINALPTTRSTEGNFPYWLGIDDRMTADEFFRGSYTMGIWLKGAIIDGLNYHVMIGNNLNNMGVSAAQLDNRVDTQSIGFNWLPTTKEFGYLGGFGDYDNHQKVATRLGAHFTHSREDKETQPSTNAIENTQIRLTDGSIVFTPNLFGPGISVERVTYQMIAADAGVKYKGFALEGEYYWRKLSNFSGSNTGAISDINDRGYQIQSSAMVIPKILQVYLAGSEILGHYGDGSEVRAGVNWFFLKKREATFNAEYIHLSHCPVGYAALPYPVGGNGDIFHANLALSF